MTEVNHRIVNLNKFGGETLYFRLINMLPCKRRVRVIVCKQLPQAIIELQDFAAARIPPRILYRRSQGPL